jgi:hypothetical protein
VPHLEPLILTIALLTACQEYRLWGRDEGPTKPADSEAPPADTAGSPPHTTDTQDSEPPPVEECNGEDDDGDGLVDEGYDDVDSDGIADCVDDHCDVDRHPGGTVEILDECTAPTIELVNDPWDVVVEWQFEVEGGGASMPAIGNLTDDNGDGRIDERDIPDIAFTTFETGQLIALHGDGSGPIFTLNGLYSVREKNLAGVAIADVDSDGEPEVISISDRDELIAVDGAGRIEWRSAPFPRLNYPVPTVADLDADGQPEVIIGHGVVDGATGATLFGLASGPHYWTTPVIADIDVDGTQEIILGETVYDHRGLVEWTALWRGDIMASAVADLDGDIEGEVIIVSPSMMYHYEADGTLIRAVTVGSYAPTFPSVADFDGDDNPEIAMASTAEIGVWEVDGTPLWSEPTYDDSSYAGCTGFDLDGDGAAELLYADQTTFRIFDGATGAVRYLASEHRSGTFYEYPVPADVDGDGAAEIVVVSNDNVEKWGTWDGITVLGHAGDGWAPAGPYWGIHDYAVSNMNPDASVPSPPPIPWHGHNVHRARPAADAVSTADLYVFLEDTCVASCEHGPAKISYAVANQGAHDAPADLSVALYALAGGTQTFVEAQTIAAVPAGAVIYGGTFEIHPDAWGPDGFLLSVDDDGTGRGQLGECDESNNLYEYTEGICG